MGHNNMVDFLEWYTIQQLPHDGCFSLELFSLPGQMCHLCTESTLMPPVKIKVLMIKMDNTCSYYLPHRALSHFIQCPCKPLTLICVVGIHSLHTRPRPRPRPRPAQGCPQRRWLHSGKLSTFSQGLWMLFLLSQDNPRKHLLWSSWIRS